MGIKRNEENFDMICDNCGKLENVQVGSQPLALGRPKHWTVTQLSFTDFDEHNNAMGDREKEYLLCDECSKRMFEFAKPLIDRERY